MKKFFKKIGAFFKHIWSKYRANWFKIIFYALLVFVMSCAWFHSCKQCSKPQATITANAEESLPIQNSDSLYFRNYAFNQFPLYNLDPLAGTVAEDKVTLNSDYSITVNGTFDTEFFKLFLTFAIEPNTDYYFAGGIAVNGGTGFYSPYAVGGLLDRVFTSTDNTSFNVYLRFPAGTYDNQTFMPFITKSSTRISVLTPPIEAFIIQQYEKGYDEGYNIGFDEGYSNGSIDGYLGGYDIGMHEGMSIGFANGQNSLKLGLFYNSTLNFNITYNDGRTRIVNDYWQDFIPSGDFHGINIGEIFFNKGYYTWTDNAFFTNVVVTITFDNPVANAVDFYLTDLPQVSNIRYQLSTNEWTNTVFSQNSVYYTGAPINSTAYALNPASDALYKAIQFTYTYDNTGNISSVPYYRGLALFTYTNAYAEGLQQGLIDTQQKVNEAYTKGYNVGYNKGREVDAEGYTFLSLIDAVGYGVTKPFVSILNFDLLGMNMLSFVTGLLTLVLIIKLCSMFI